MKRYTMIGIYKHESGDCSNNGLSAHYDSVNIVDADEVIEANPNHLRENDVVIIVDECQGEKRTRAVPALHWKLKRWDMFGGCAVYTSNGRVPHHGKFIKLYDRFE